MKSLLILLITQLLSASSNLQTQCDTKIYSTMIIAEQSMSNSYVDCTELNKAIHTFTQLQLSCPSKDVQDVLPTLQQVYKQECK